MLKPDHCASCLGIEWSKQGFVPASGSGENGVLIVAEAAGEHEALEAMPLVGRAGYYTWTQLKRVGLEREAFRIHNVLSCRPPNNKLAKQPYEDAVIASCSPILDATIADMHEVCRRHGKTFVILTLGRIAFKRIMGFTDKDPVMHKDYIGYPFWNEKYGAWVFAADHPSYLMRGNNHLVPVLQFVAKRAVEVAEHGLTYHQPEYLRDPDPATFEQWVRDYLRECGPNTYLAFDIETPHKQGKDEEEVAREDDDDYTILRCSFAYRAGRAVSVPWRADYLPILEELFASKGTKLVWNENYDVPRITAQIPIHGDIWDAMLMWHVLNSALPKGLGFVTPFYAQDMPMWKHMSTADPAGYNCQDSDALLRDTLGIVVNLRENGLWPVFERHVVELNRGLMHMSRIGLQRDEVMRAQAEKDLSVELDGIETKMEASVPKEARRLSPKNGYTKAPKDTTGMVQAEFTGKVKRCIGCGLINPKKDHFKVMRRKKPTKKCPDPPMPEPNPCEGLGVEVREESVTRWAKLLEFKISKVGLQNYQKVLRHQAIVNRRENRVTFDETAIEALIKKYPKDPLYPLILEHREYQKLLGTYVGVTQIDGRIKGGLQIGRDGRIHPTFSHNPSTLRLACQNPNMQNLPRGSGDPDAVNRIIRNLVVAGDGYLFIERDFSAIEAVLVGYFAGNADYIRLAKLGIHAYLASHVLGRPADLKWSNADLKAYFREIKKSKDPHVEMIYNGSKRTAHLSGYGGTPSKMHKAEPKIFPTLKDAERLQGIYFELCPYIKKWHLATQLQAEKDGFLRNPFGYVHRFYRVFSYERIAGKWIRKQGDDANKVLAFLPQSTAAGIIKEAMLRLYQYEDVWQALRLQVHDSLLAEASLAAHETIAETMRVEMEKPIPELRLPMSMGLGPLLNIDTELKKGSRWGSMT